MTYDSFPPMIPGSTSRSALAGAFLQDLGQQLRTVGSQCGLRFRADRLECHGGWREVCFEPLTPGLRRSSFSPNYHNLPRIVEEALRRIGCAWTLRADGAVPRPFPDPTGTIKLILGPYSPSRHPADYDRRSTIRDCMSEPRWFQ